MFILDIIVQHLSFVESLTKKVGLINIIAHRE